MLKGIIIITLAFYVFYRITSFFFKAGAASQQSNRPLDSDVNNSKAKKKSGGPKGGEYIDYEEVK